jgi:CRISPR-associated protein Cas1
MGYRQIYIRKTEYLSLKNESLCIKKQSDSEEIFIPIEDISSVLIEDPHTTVTTRLLTEMSRNGIITYLCDNCYNPNTLILPLNIHYNQLGVYNKQISLQDGHKSKLWQKIIKMKIHNQKLVLSYTSNDEDDFRMLEGYEKSIKINDYDNREGIASKVFFTSLYGEDFIRFSTSHISSALNYGYTIIHGAIVRALVLYGFNTYLGVWHNSNQNAFNLASDFIEPLRPIVDYWCYWMQNIIESPLSTDNRKGLISLLNEKVSIDNKLCTVEYAIDTMIKSYLCFLDTKQITSILLPEIVGLNFHELESV